MAKKSAYYGALLSLAIICGYIEFLIPFNIGVPGVKLGLSNIVAVYLLYKNGFMSAVLINISRILICGILFGNIMSIIYALSGGVLSILVMVLLKKVKVFSAVGVSMAGGVAHNLGQIIAAAVVLGTNAVIYYLPFLNIAGLITGFLVGLAAAYLIRRVNIKNML